MSNSPRGLFSTGGSSWDHSQRKHRVGKSRSDRKKGGIQTATGKAPGRRNQGVENGGLVDGHRPLCAPVPRIQTGASASWTQKPAAKPSSQPSGCLGLSARPVVPTAQAWMESHFSPPCSWRGLTAPGFLAVFHLGFGCTAGGREGIVAAMPLRREWKVGHRVGRS